MGHGNYNKGVPDAKHNWAWCMLGYRKSQVD